LDDQNDTVREDNDPVVRTVIEVALVHPAEFDPETMPLGDVAAMIDMGHFASRRTVTESRPIPDGEVDSELERVDAQAGFFAVAAPHERRGGEES
jgi:hypothetical protein